MEDDHAKELEEQRVAIVSQVMAEGGLTRRNIVSDEYHNNRDPWLSKNLCSRPWKEHKARGMTCFGHMVEGFDCNTTGKAALRHLRSTARAL